MKRILAIAIMACIGLSACNKEEQDAMTVIKDCTGTYLRKNGFDYRVCNTEKTLKFNHEARVRVTYKNLKQCTGPEMDAPVCEKFHHNAGWIEIVHIW
jgi:hypothetical protein